MDFTDLSSLLSVGGSIASAYNPVIGEGLMAGSALLAQKGQNKARQMVPPESDPTQMKFLGEIDRMRKSFETGSAYQAEMRQLKNQQSATNQGIIRLAGGNAGAAIAGINRAGQATMNAYGDIAARGEQRQDMFTQMYGSLLNEVADRKLNIQNLKYNQAMADSTAQKSKSLQDLMNLGAVMGKTNANPAMFNMAQDNTGTSGGYGFNVMPTQNPYPLGMNPNLTF